MNTNLGGISKGGLNMMGARANSASFALQQPKLRRFENLIFRLKKILEQEKKNLRYVKTMCAKEIDQKNQLEKILRQCVDDVKNEIVKKKTESKVQYYQKGGSRARAGLSSANILGLDIDDKNLSKAERLKILEVLMSQERVLTLLYDKTFPPRSQSQAVGLQGVRDLASSQKQRISKSAKGLYPKSQLGRESMRTFNYYG